MIKAAPIKNAKIPSKEAVAAKLARLHYRVERGMVNIFRLLSPTRETDPREPIKLLEVNKNTITAGVMPLWFGTHSRSGIHYPSVLIEITPQEYKLLQQGKLTLPDDWVIEKKPYPKPR